MVLESNRDWILPITADAEKPMTNALKVELKLFASTGNQGHCLQKAYNYLMSIPATSVEAERAFSAAGALCTKLQSRSADDAIDTVFSAIILQKMP